MAAEMTFGTVQAILQEQGLACMFSAFCAKQIKDFKCRPNGGDEVTGTRFEVPEFVVADGKVTVTLHHVLVDVLDWWAFHDLVMKDRDEDFRTWAQMEPVIQACPKVLYRSKKSGLSVSRFVASLQTEVSKDSTKIEQAAAEITRRLKCPVEDLTVELLTGPKLAEWYNENDGCTHSCMTGYNSPKTEVWGTNPNQCALAVFKDGDKPIGRGLVFRPTDSFDPAPDNLEFGPGWFYGRVYYVSERGASGAMLNDQVERVKSFCERKGVLTVDKAADSGVVPLIQTEYAPYIDRGYLYHMNKVIGSKVLWVPPRYSKIDRLEGWKETNNNQYGNAWGRQFDDEDSDSGHYCACCEERCGVDDLHYVEGYGDVCDSCVDNGDFAYCCDETYRHVDEAYEIKSETLQFDYEYAPRRERISIRSWPINRNYTITLSRTVVLREATIDKDDSQGMVPEDETTLVGGRRIWNKLIEDGTFVEVSHVLSMRDDGAWCVETRETTWVSREEVAHVLKFESTEVSKAYPAEISCSSFNWEERNLLSQAGTYILHYDTEVYAGPKIKRAIGNGEYEINRFMRVGPHAMLVKFDATKCVTTVAVPPTTSSNLYPVGHVISQMPYVTLSTASMIITSNGSVVGTMYFTKYEQRGMGTFYASCDHPTGYMVSYGHPCRAIESLFRTKAHEYDMRCKSMYASNYMFGSYAYVANGLNTIKFDRVLQSGYFLILFNGAFIVGVYCQLHNELFTVTTATWADNDLRLKEVAEAVYMKQWSDVKAYFGGVTV